MSYSMTHYCTAIFGSGRADWTCNLVIKSKLHVGHKCVVVEHTAEDYLHLCFKNTGC